MTILVYNSEFVHLLVDLSVPNIQIIPNFFEGEGSHSLSLLRLDLPDPIAGGNKFFKMKYNLEEMKRIAQKRLMTFGGAFSNHIVAVAYAGKKNGIETVGIIRGDELTEMSNQVLEFASNCGMRLVFISREDYRKRNDAEFCEALLSEFGPAYLLPEGGSNDFAVMGCGEILSAETEMYDVIVCPVGTGATLAGIISSAKSHQLVIGIAVLNGKDYLEKEVEKHLKGKSIAAQWKIEHDFTLGRYGKSNTELEKFIVEMNEKYDLPLDPIYSGKALMALTEIKKGTAFQEKQFLFVHTGGYAFMK